MNYGTSLVWWLREYFECFVTNHTTCSTDGTPGVPDAQTGEGDDFLARERAALGDDAAQFAGADDNDLLGEGATTNGDADVSKFQSSFPAVDAGANEVRSRPTHVGTRHA